MALTYRNGRPYSYRSIRRDGKMTSEYRGAGQSALLIEQNEANARDRREAEQAGYRAEQYSIETAERPLSEYFDQIESLVRSALLASGFYLHNREWRRRHARRE